MPSGASCRQAWIHSWALAVSLLVSARACFVVIFSLLRPDRGSSGSNVFNMTRDVGNISSGQASRRTGSRRASTTASTRRRSRRASNRPRGVALRDDPRDRARRLRWRGCARLARAVRRPGVPDAGRARDRHRGRLADLLRPGATAFGAFPPPGRSTILLGQVVFNASLAMLIIRARFVGMGASSRRPRYDLGSGPLSTFRQVTLPRLMPAVIAGFCSASRSRSTTSSSRLHDRHHVDLADPALLGGPVRHHAAVNALASLMLLVTLVLIVVVVIILRRSRVVGPGQEEGGLGAAFGLG